MEHATPIEKNNTPTTTEHVDVFRITSLEQRRELIKSSPLLVLKLGAEWCNPCKKIAPLFVEMAQRSTQGKEYICASEDIDDDFGDHGTIFRSIPVFHIYKNGEYISQVVGTDMEKLQADIDGILETDKFFLDNMNE